VGINGRWKKPRSCGAFFWAALLFPVLFTPGGAEEATGTDAAPTVLITGANRGIGLEFARQYAERGWSVIATCRNPGRAAELNAIAARHENVTVERMDVIDYAGVDALAAKYRGTPIDVLLNNAALLGDPGEQSLGQLDYDKYERILAVNIIGPMKVIEAFVANVEISTQKKIVTLGSAAGSNGLLGPGLRLYAYRSSKAGLHMAMNALAMDLADRGIIVGLINPGLVDTRGVLDLKPGEPAPEIFRPLMPLVRSGQIELIRPAESVAAMIGLIDELMPGQSGAFINYDGATLPW